MKIIKYRYCNRDNVGTAENHACVVEIRCTTENLAANEEIAKREAYNGEYTVEDDA